MGKNVNTIKCPNCGQEIDVNELLYHQLSDEIESKYREKLVSVKKETEEALKKKIEDEQSEILKTLQEELKEKSQKLKDCER